MNGDKPESTYIYYIIAKHPLNSIQILTTNDPIDVLKTSYKYPIVISQSQGHIRFDLLVLKAVTKDLFDTPNLTTLDQSSYLLYTIGQTKLNITSDTSIKMFTTYFNSKSIYYCFYNRYSLEMHLVEMRFSKKDTLTYKFKCEMFTGVSGVFLIDSIFNRADYTEYIHMSKQNNNLMIYFLKNKDIFSVKNKNLCVVTNDGLLTYLEGYNTILNLNIRDYLDCSLGLKTNINAKDIIDITNSHITVSLGGTFNTFHLDFCINEEMVLIYFVFFKDLIDNFYEFIENILIIFVQHPNDNKLLLLFDYLLTIFALLFKHQYDQGQTLPNLDEYKLSYETVKKEGFFIINKINNIHTNCYDLLNEKKEHYLLQINEFSRLLFESQILTNHYSDQKSLIKFISCLLNIYNNPLVNYNYFIFFNSYDKELNLDSTLNLTEQYKLELFSIIDCITLNEMSLISKPNLNSMFKLINIFRSLKGLDVLTTESNSKLNFCFGEYTIVLNNFIKNESPICFKTNLIVELIKAETSLDKIKQFHPIIAITLLDEIKKYKSKTDVALTSDTEMNKKILMLLDRSDLVKNLSISEGLINTNALESNPLISTMLYENHNTNYESDFYLANIKFSNDSRFKEALRILNPSRFLKVNTSQLSNTDSNTYELERLSFALKHIYRQHSCCIGNGAIYLNTIKTFPKDTLTIKPLNMIYISSTDNISYKLDVSSEYIKDKEFDKWPEFHNGVSQSIRLCTEFFNNKSYIRNWIQFNKPVNPNYEHGGFLFAMGLLKQLDSLLSTDIYQYMKLAHDGVTIGILLGRAASKISTMEDALSRTLCLHIAYLIPSNLEINIPVTIQSAASVGLGLLYLGTGNRLMTEMLLEQIGKKISEKNININNIESYNLSLGFAIGLINLAMGNSHNQDLKLEEKLLNFANGGKKLTSKQTNDILLDIKQYGSYVEENEINTRITSTCAYACLTFIYLQTGNNALASKIKIPTNLAQLNTYRPFYFYLAIFAKNLISYNIEPTEDWIFSQIPEYIKFLFENNIATISNDILYTDKLNNIEFTQVAMSYYYCICAGIISIAFKHIGTNNIDTALLILHFITKVRKAHVINDIIVHGYAKYNDNNKNCINKNTLYSCLCICSYALAIVMAGSGDLSTFKTLRVIRKIIDSDFNPHNYGYYQAIHHAIGILFLGAGGLTLSNNKQAIALTYISIFPVFATNTNDNDKYLQALRHLYVLACETKILETREIESNKVVSTDLVMKYVDGRDVVVKTPFNVNL
jgi:hypothetical protein